jgi:ribosomal protein L18E
LVDNGVIKDTVDMTVYNRLATKNEIVKILGRGELKAKLKVTAHKFTATAKAAIEAARRSCNNVIFINMKKFIESISNVWKIEELKIES